MEARLYGDASRLQLPDGINVTSICAVNNVLLLGTSEGGKPSQ